MLNGSSRVRWTSEQFETALAEAGEPRIAGRFVIVHAGLGVFCDGSYAVTGDRLRLLTERRDVPLGCGPGRLLDAKFVLTDEALTFRATTAHPVDAVLFASRRLTRVED